MWFKKKKKSTMTKKQAWEIINACTKCIEKGYHLGDKTKQKYDEAIEVISGRKE